MKSVIKSTVTLCITALLVIGVMLTALATDAEIEYSGTMEELQPLVDAIGQAADSEAVKTAILAVSDYLDKKPVDPELEGYTEAMATVYGAVVDCAGGLVSASESGAVADRANNIKGAVALLNAFEIPADTEGYSELRAKVDVASLNVANAYLSSVDELKLNESSGYYNTAKVSSQVKTLRAFVKAAPLNEELDGYSMFVDAFRAQENALADAVAYNKAFEERKASLSDYSDYSQSFSYDFSSMPKFGAMSGVKTDTSDYLKTEDNGNQYYSFFWDSQVQKYWQTSISGSNNAVDATKGFVLEFDISANEGDLATLTVENGSAQSYSHPDVKIFAIYLRFNEKGIPYHDTKKNIIDYPVVLPGEWTHISLIFHFESCSMDLYCDYEYLTSYSVLGYKNGNEFIYDYIPTNLRFGANNGKGTVNVDNVKLYEGMRIVDKDRLNNMTDDERLLFYSNYLPEDLSAVTGMSASEISVAYDGVAALLPQYYNAATGEYLTEDSELVSAVDRYLAFDYNILLDMLKENNLNTFVEYVDSYEQLGRSLVSGDISKRQSMANRISEYLVECGPLMLDNELYRETNNRLSELNSALAIDGLIIKFIASMNRFAMVDTVSAMQRHYNNASGFLNDETNPISAGMAEELIMLDAYSAFKDAYEAYKKAKAELTQRQREDNSEKIVNCVGFISVYTTEEEWLANEEYVNKYVTILRRTIREGNYDPNYEGVAEALAILEPIENFFYARMQNGHVAVLSELLESVALVDSYIEKMGVASYITRYFETNDIDYSNPEINTIYVNHQTLLGELAIRKDDYEKLLVENSSYFLSAVEKMRLSSTYQEKKSYYEKATLYYFSLNAAVEGVSDAIAVYDSYTDYFERVEKASLMFVESIVALEAAESRDELFEALVDCYGYSLDAENAVDGVEEAFGRYRAIYDEYMNEINNANEEIETSALAMGSVRANSGVSHIIAVIIKKIFA